MVGQLDYMTTVGPFQLKSSVLFYSVLFCSVLVLTFQTFGDITRPLGKSEILFCFSKKELSSEGQGASRLPPAPLRAAVRAVLCRTAMGSGSATHFEGDGCTMSGALV